MNSYVDVDDLRQNARYLAEVTDCCVGGDLDLGRFNGRTDYTLRFDNATLHEWGGVQFREEGL